MAAMGDKTRVLRCRAKLATPDAGERWNCRDRERRDQNRKENRLSCNDWRPLAGAD